MCACLIIGGPDTRYLELIMGGRKAAHFRCTKCRREYDLDGRSIDGRA